jgi:AcrR family transcriptional regulator
MGQRRTKGAERELSVVTAAAELIAEQGLAQLRMADVADRAGMSVGHVTYYFPSKTELLVRAIQQSESQFQAEVREALHRHDDAWERLVALVELAAASGPGDPGWLLWFEVWANAAADPELAEVQQQLDGWWRQQMAEVISYGTERGTFRPTDPERAGLILSALTDGLSVQLALGSDAVAGLALIDIVTGVARDLLGVDS